MCLGSTSASAAGQQRALPERPLHAGPIQEARCRNALFTAARAVPIQRRVAGTPSVRQVVDVAGTTNYRKAAQGIRPCRPPKGGFRHAGTMSGKRQGTEPKGGENHAPSTSHSAGLTNRSLGRRHTAIAVQLPREGPGWEQKNTLTSSPWLRRCEMLRFKFRITQACRNLNSKVGTRTKSSSRPPKLTP